MQNIYGGDLQTKVAARGTVILDVDHQNESYAINVQDGWYDSDFNEIRDYLHAHGFEILDYEECPAEMTHFGWRLWASHKEGKVFA